MGAPMIYLAACIIVGWFIIKIVLPFSLGFLMGVVDAGRVAKGKQPFVGR